METGKFFEGFVESIVGLKAGDEAAVPVTFPSNHKVLREAGPPDHHDDKMDSD